MARQSVGQYLLNQLPAFDWDSLSDREFHERLLQIRQLCESYYRKPKKEKPKIIYDDDIWPPVFGSELMRMAKYSTGFLPITKEDPADPSKYVKFVRDTKYGERTMADVVQEYMSKYAPTGEEFINLQESIRKIRDGLE